MKKKASYVILSLDIGLLALYRVSFSLTNLEKRDGYPHGTILYKFRCDNILNESNLALIQLILFRQEVDIASTNHKTSKHAGTIATP